MILPSDAELLAGWERAEPQSWVERALTLLGVFHPELSHAELSRLPIGERDARLLAIRAAMFGPDVECLASCPRCSERMEATFSIDAVRAQYVGNGAGVAELHNVALDGYEVTFRLPNSTDLLTLDACHDGRSPERLLLAACVVETKSESAVIDTDSIPDHVAGVIAERLGDADPLADVQLALACAACGHTWAATFDIVTHLWAEVDTRARRLLAEVHTLARAYGWRERDILALRPTRRSAYLELVGAQ